MAKITPHGVIIVISSRFRAVGPPASYNLQNLKNLSSDTFAFLKTQ
jgi:hypothetical protein